MKKTFLLILFFTLLFGCNKNPNPDIRKLTLGIYTVPKEVYQKEIIPGFKKYWKNQTGEEIQIYESYMASGAQSRTIASGFEADIAALSLETDINRLKQSGLITHDWKKGPTRGFVTRSVVVICYRRDNPKSIKGWEDLKRPDVYLLFPSPKTSGGAMWVVNAIYGSGLLQSEQDQKAKDPHFARTFLKDIQRRVKVMDKSGRASVTTFENGIGDALITYENEALLRQKQGKEFPFIVPQSTILIENPVALLDRNVDKHGNRDLAEAFIRYLFSREIQRSFAEYGFRPVDESVMKENKQKFPLPPKLFDIEYLGGWEQVHSYLYGPRGIWTEVMEELASE